MKQTESKVLGHLARNNQLTASDRDKLLKKVGKDQTKGRARDITDVVETEFQQQLAAMTQGDQTIVQKAIKDYTLSSDAINTSCRQGNPDPGALQLDQAFAIYDGHGFTNKQRVVYRLMTYKPGNACPYGAARAPQIVRGDLIRDLGFLSTSENRQFLVNGIKNPPPGSRYIKFVIVGKGGINISGGGQYTNANEEAFLKQIYANTHMFRTAEAGQAEILFARETVLRIETLSMVGQDVHVFATIPSPQPGAAGVKNGFTGV